jgi:hypothetical protein
MISLVVQTMEAIKATSNRISAVVATIERIASRPACWR